MLKKISSIGISMLNGKKQTIDTIKKFNPYESIDVYKFLPKKYLKVPRTYKNFNKIKIPIPIRVNVVGSSGSGKTQCLLNLVTAFGCFTKFYIFAGDIEEPIYTFLIDVIKDTYGDDAVFTSNNLQEMPEIGEFDPEENNLVIIDDLLAQKSNKDPNTLNLFYNGRKANVSVIYVSQSYFAVHPSVRKNSNVVCLLRFDDQQDLGRILNKVKGSIPIETFDKVYRMVCNGNKHNYFTISNDSPPGFKYRANLGPIGMEPEDLDEEE